MQTELGIDVAVVDLLFGCEYEVGDEDPGIELVFEAVPVQAVDLLSFDVIDPQDATVGLVLPLVGQLARSLDGRRSRRWYNTVS